MAVGIYYYPLQDAHQKKVTALPPEHQIAAVKSILIDGHKSLVEYSEEQSQVTQDYLDSLAGVRFALSVVVDKMKNGSLDDADLHKAASELCTDTQVNLMDPTGLDITTGPVLYILRLLVRQFGFPYLKTITQTYPWVMPQAPSDVGLYFIDFMILF